MITKMGAFYAFAIELNLREMEFGLYSIPDLNGKKKYIKQITK